MRKQIFIIIIGIWLFTSYPVYGFGMAGQPVPWLDWSVGARTISLGRSNAVLDSRGASVVLNPADLAWQEENYLTLMHTPSEGEVNYDFGGINYSFQDSPWGIGLGFQGLATTKIAEYDYDGNFVGYFSNNERALSIGVGQKLYPNLAIGGVIKLIQQNIYTERGLGYSTSFGFKWQPFDQVVIGAVAANVLGEVHWTTGLLEKPPVRLRIGGQYYWEDLDLLVTGDYLHDPGDTPVHLGIEKGYKQNLRLRAGLDGMTPTLGVGLVMARLEIDYALMLDFDLGKRQYLSLNWRY